MPNIVFVCTANRYRSPIAEACFKQVLAEQGLDQDWDVSSAGTWTEDDLPPMPDAVEKASELGVNIQAHRSRVINDEIIQAADAVLVMEQGQK